MLGLAASGIEYGPLYGLALFGLNLALVMLLFVMVDHGRIISPAYGRLDPRELEKLRAMRQRSALARRPDARAPVGTPKPARVTGGTP